MKKFKLLYILTALSSLLTSCGNDDDSAKDQIYEFVSFQKETITVNENTASTVPVPVAIKLLGYEPKEDITVNLSVTNTNVTEGEDYTLSRKTLTFKPGNFVSDTLYVSTIDNQQGTDLERSLTINIESISNPEIKIGLGIENPVNASLKVVIADDECSNTVAVFNSSLSNQNNKGTTTITSSVTNDLITLVGDIIVYTPFSNAKLELTLTPVSEGATRGTATFDDYDAGTDSDGYVYQFRQSGEGTYDVCSGEIIISFDVYYESGGAWVYWYTSNNKITIE